MLSWYASRRRTGAPWLALATVAALGAAACGPAPAPSPAPSATATPPPPSATGTLPPSSSPVVTFPLGSAPPTGFAFDAESVALYYESRGYACGEAEPSAQAAGHLFRTCTFVDPDGRTRVVGLVTDPAGDLADGFASIRGASGETFLDPTVALEPLAGFLGAMLGEERASALLPWLAGHLGDEYAETMAADLHVATYTLAPDDRSTLVVEVANEAYLESPRPSPS